MGRYLASGIATKISVFGADGYDIIGHKKEILEKLNDSLDVSKYEIVDYDDGFALRLDKQYFEENIHDFIHEVSAVMDVESYFLYELEQGLEKFTKENVPIKVSECQENYVMNFPNDSSIEESLAAFQNFSYILLNKDFDLSNIDIEVMAIPIDVNFDSKCNVEDETELLRLLNLYSRGYYKSNLGKHLIYFILG